MNTIKHRLEEFVIGLAYALEKSSEIISGQPDTLKAFLFSFQEKRKAERLFMNLMNFVLRVNPPDSWILHTASEYIREPLAERYFCWDTIVESFFTNRNILEEETFHYSHLKPEYRQPAQIIYSKHKNGFDFLIRTMCRAKRDLDPHDDFGILFVQQDN